MAIYKILNDELLPLSATSFARESIKERDDLQRLIKKRLILFHLIHWSLLKNLANGKVVNGVLIY